MQRILVGQHKINETQVEAVESPALQEGEARLKLESFALTANNISYAASGFAVGYWQFFPTGVEEQGIVPVWGVAKVIESKAEDLAVGTRLYGFYPMAEELVMLPKVSSRGGVTDIAPHRVELPAVYNKYAPIPPSTPEQDHVRALLQPLLATSYLLADWLADNEYFGAEQVIIGSASSKTGLGLCKYLAEPERRPYQIVGLTSERNKEFVAGLGACDTILTYDEIEKLDGVPSVYVDMAGNAQVKAALHTHLGDHLKHSAAVGISHWDQFNPRQEYKGIKPKFFFAPAQIAKRREEWGPGVIDRKVEEAFLRLASEASSWMDVKVHRGLDAVPEVYAALIDGALSPQEGHVIRLVD